MNKIIKIYIHHGDIFSLCLISILTLSLFYCDHQFFLLFQKYHNTIEKKNLQIFLRYISQTVLRYFQKESRYLWQCHEETNILLFFFFFCTDLTLPFFLLHPNPSKERGTYTWHIRTNFKRIKDGMSQHVSHVPKATLLLIQWKWKDLAGDKITWVVAQSIIWIWAYKLSIWNVLL